MAKKERLEAANVWFEQAVAELERARTSMARGVHWLKLAGVGDEISLSALDGIDKLIELCGHSVEAKVLQVRSAARTLPREPEAWSRLQALGTMDERAASEVPDGRPRQHPGPQALIQEWQDSGEIP